MIDMNEMMKKAQELSETMKQQQEELAKQIISVSVGGEMVKMTFNGKQEAISIEIDPEVVDADDIETLQDLILSAVNEGLRQSQQNMQNSLGQQIGKMTGGLDLSSILNPKT
jgi:DNA-binding YbaB/EbfC family protein